VRLDDGTVARQALVVGPRMVARSEVLASLGLQPTAHPLGAGTFIPSDPSGQTAVPGVWVAGNVTNLAATVIVAAAEGVTAAAAINADLVAEETRRAVAALERRAAA
jgi:thioredoxin reductase